MKTKFPWENNCCGCSACENVCPFDAIEMCKDKKGFYKPVVDTEKCKNCGLCSKVCDFNKEKLAEKGPLQTVAAIHKKEDIRQRSRSGGFFMAVCQWICDNGGIVFGAAIDSDMVVRHSEAESFEECKKFQGSKYVQSDVGDCFERVKEALERQQWVCFSGTACQVAGLYSYLSYLEINREKLILIDIVCHGVISSNIFRDYLIWIQAKYKGNITEFNFRDKSFGWTPHVESWVIRKKKYIDSVYTELYYSGLANGEGCFKCRYTTLDRISDFTLADCWGVERKLPEMYDNKGVSMILINSQKASNLFGEISDTLTYRDIDVAEFMQPQLRNPIKKDARYDFFWKEYEEKNFSYILKKYAKYNCKSRIKRWIKRKILYQY